MPNTVVIRPATPADREFLIAISSRLADFDRPCWRSAEEIANGDRRALEQALDGPPDGSALFIAEIDGKAAGCLLMWTVLDYFSSERHAHISVIAVTKETEGQGLGGALMAHAERWARENGSSRITLSVFETNHRAQRLYERSGYQVEMRRYLKPL